MKRFYTIVLCLAFCTIVGAQGPWKFRMVCAENEITLAVDLYEESIDVPGMSMFGPMNGYISGKGVWGVWMVTSYKILSDKKAELHLSNDQGSETQPVRLTLNDDGSCLFEEFSGSAIKKVENNKLVKVPSKMVFKGQD